MRMTQGIAEIMLRDRITTIDQGKDSRSVFTLLSFFECFISDSDEAVKDSISWPLDSDVDKVERALFASRALFTIL